MSQSQDRDFVIEEAPPPNSSRRQTCIRRLSGYVSYTFTGLPVAADLSQANMISCVLIASRRLVKGISTPAEMAVKNASNWVW